MAHFRTTPTYELPMTVGKNIHTAWWRWLQDTDRGSPPSSELIVLVIGSPFTYAATMKGNLIVSGGTVSAIELSRSGTFYLTGLTTGLFNLAANDRLRVTYSAIPALVFLPT